MQGFCKSREPEDHTGWGRTFTLHVTCRSRRPSPAVDNRASQSWGGLCGVVRLISADWGIYGSVRLLCCLAFSGLLLLLLSSLLLLHLLLLLLVQSPATSWSSSKVGSCFDMLIVTHASRLHPTCISISASCLPMCLWLCVRDVSYRSPSRRGGGGATSAILGRVSGNTCASSARAAFHRRA